MANEELIMHAREFTESPNLGRDMARELDKALIYIRELADIAEAAEARVKGFEANFPCDGGCNYDSGPEERCSLHGRNPADLWGIIANISAERYEAEARVKELEAGEWEYRCVKAAEWTGGMSVILPRAHYHADCPRRGFRTERRTTAGPWVPVESEGE